jgi:hypothetical protein
VPAAVRFNNWLGAFGLAINGRRTRARGRDTVNIKTANLFGFLLPAHALGGMCRSSRPTRVIAANQTDVERPLDWMSAAGLLSVTCRAPHTTITHVAII